MDSSVSSTTPAGLYSASVLFEHHADQLAFGRPVQAHHGIDKQLSPPACIVAAPPVTSRKELESSPIACRTQTGQEVARLLMACHTGDCEAVRAQLHENRGLASKAVSTEQSEQGYTALGVAARAGYVEIVRLLLEAGADVNSRSGPQGRTPLMQAGLHASGKEPELPADLVKALAQQPPPRAAQPEPDPACMRDPIHCLRLLINSGADIEATDSQNRSALYHRANSGNSEALGLLAEHGAKVGGWSSSTSDPLYAAAFKGHLGCVLALLSAGTPVMTGRKYGYSALNAAAENGHVEILQYLLQQGVSVNAKSSPFGDAPLLVASETGQLACMQILLDACLLYTSDAADE